MRPSDVQNCPLNFHADIVILLPFCENNKVLLQVLGLPSTRHLHVLPYLHLHLITALLGVGNHRRMHYGSRSLYTGLPFLALEDYKDYFAELWVLINV